ncbi:four helix bundle protein [Verrucomicrobiota bacterium]
MQFPHEKLSVYQKALDFFGDVQGFVLPWSRQHAFVDHLLRAAESILFNLVEAVRLHHAEKKTLTLDYAVGSVLECAACLDIAVLRSLLASAVAVEKKGSLLELCKMLVGLRNSWCAPRVSEDPAEYETDNEADGEGPVFYHETMDRYVVALDFYRWFVSTGLGTRGHTAFEKSADTLATRMLLNIAESNGRYAALSRQTFLDTANAAAAKLAVLLDMGVRRGVLDKPEVERGKGLLVRVGQMTARKDYPDR